MKFLTKFGGLVAVAALLMAAGSLLVSPSPVHAAIDTACETAGGAIFSDEDGTAAGGTAVATVGSASTTTVYVLIDQPTAAAGDVIGATVSAGTINGASSGAALSVTTADVAGCTNAGLAVGDTGVAADSYAEFEFVAPTVASDTLVTVTVTLEGAAAGFGAVTVLADVTLESMTVDNTTNDAIPATPGGAGPEDHAALEVLIEDDNGDPVAGETVTIITSLGLLETAAGNCSVDANDAIDNGTQACTADTDGAGQVFTSLFGAGAGGTATVTILSGTFSDTVEVVIYGDVDSGTAVSENATVQVDGTTEITVTIVDTNGNPVADVVIVDGDIAIAGPGTTDITATGAATGADNDCAVGAEGTDGDGECVIQVDATDADFGDHVITIDAGDAGDLVLTITVADETASVTHDAPATVAAGSQTEITVTGLDANGVNVGDGVGGSIVQIEGDGGLLPSPLPSVTTDGALVFTFVAASQTGTSSLLVQIDTISVTITITVGAAAPTPGAGFAKDPLDVGFNITTYGGGTVAELEADGAAAGATSVAVTVDGAFVILIVGAPSFVNQAFNDAFPAGVTAGEGVIVTVS